MASPFREEEDEDECDSSGELLPYEYIVEEVIDHKTVGQLRAAAKPGENYHGAVNAVRFRVRWVNFSPDEDTWEPASNLLANSAFNLYCMQHRLRKRDGKPDRSPGSNPPPDPRPRSAASRSPHQPQYNFVVKVPQSPKKPVRVKGKSSCGKVKEKTSVEKQIKEALKKKKVKSKEIDENNLESSDPMYPSSSCSSERSANTETTSNSDHSVFEKDNNMNEESTSENNSSLSISVGQEETETAVASISNDNFEEENMITEETEDQTVTENTKSVKPMDIIVDTRKCLLNQETMAQGCKNDDMFDVCVSASIEDISLRINANAVLHELISAASSSVNNIFDNLNENTSKEQNNINENGDSPVNMEDDVILETRIVRIDDEDDEIIINKSPPKLRIAISSGSERGVNSNQPQSQTQSPQPSSTSDFEFIADEELEHLIERSKELAKFEPELLPISDLGTLALYGKYLDIENKHEYAKELSEDKSLYLSERLKQSFLCGHSTQARKLLNETFKNLSIFQRQDLFSNTFIPNVQNDHDMTLLMALSWDRKSIPCCDENSHPWCKNMKLLLDYGVDINAKTNENWTALMVAVNNGAKCQIAVLAKNGADPSITTSDGRTALHFAVERGGDLQIIRWLLWLGGDMNVSANCGYYDESNMTVLNLVGCKQFENIHIWNWMNDRSRALDNKLNCWLMEFLKNMPGNIVEEWPTGSIAPCHCWPVFNKTGLPQTRVFNFRFTDLPVMGPEHGLRAVLFIVPFYYMESEDQAADQLELHPMDKINDGNLLPKITKVKLNDVDQKVVDLKTAWLATLDCLNTGMYY